MFPKIIVSEDIPKDTILLLPRVEIVRFLDPDGQVICERLEYERKACAAMTGLPLPKEELKK